MLLLTQELNPQQTILTLHNEPDKMKARKEPDNFNVTETNRAS